MTHGFGTKYAGTDKPWPGQDDAGELHAHLDLDQWRRVIERSESEEECGAIAMPKKPHAEIQARNSYSINPDGLLRLKDIIGDRKAVPPIAPLIPISAVTWWRGVRDGRFPAPIKFSENVTCWRAREVLALIESIPHVQQNPKKK